MEEVNSKLLEQIAVFVQAYQSRLDGHREEKLPNREVVALRKAEGLLRQVRDAGDQSFTREVDSLMRQVVQVMAENRKRRRYTETQPLFDVGPILTKEEREALLMPLPVDDDGPGAEAELLEFIELFLRCSEQGRAGSMLPCYQRALRILKHFQGRTPGELTQVLDHVVRLKALIEAADSSLQDDTVL